MKPALMLMFLFLLPGHFVGFLKGLQSIAAVGPLWHPLLAGFGIGFLIWLFLISRLPGVSTFEHELTHALIALVFLRRVMDFKVTWSRGGYMSYSGGLGGEFGNSMIGLAPYFLPTFSVILALVGAALGVARQPGFLLAVGGTLAYHTFSTMRETAGNWQGGVVEGVSGLSQTDIGKQGQFYSVVVISSLTLACHALVWWLLIDGFKAVPWWLNQNLQVSLAFYTNIWHNLVH